MTPSAVPCCLHVNTSMRGLSPCHYLWSIFHCQWRDVQFWNGVDLPNIVFASNRNGIRGAMAHGYLLGKCHLPYKLCDTSISSTGTRHQNEQGQGDMKHHLHKQWVNCQTLKEANMLCGCSITSNHGCTGTKEKRNNIPRLEYCCLVGVTTSVITF
jgi:hypothetical protein